MEKISFQVSTALSATPKFDLNPTMPLSAITVMWILLFFISWAVFNVVCALYFDIRIYWLMTKNWKAFRVEERKTFLWISILVNCSRRMLIGFLAIQSRIHHHCLLSYHHGPQQLPTFVIKILNFNFRRKNVNFSSRAKKPSSSWLKCYFPMSREAGALLYFSVFAILGGGRAPDGKTVSCIYFLSILMFFFVVMEAIFMLKNRRRLASVSSLRALFLGLTQSSKKHHRDGNIVEGEQQMKFNYKSASIEESLQDFPLKLFPWFPIHWSLLSRSAHQPPFKINFDL